MTTTSAAAARTVVVVLVIAVVAGGVPAVGAQSTETTVNFDLTATFGGVAADGTTRTVHVTAPDALAGAASLGDASASAADGSATVVRTSIVDGPDDDGTRDSLAVVVRVGGGGRTSLSVSVAGTASDPGYVPDSLSVPDTGVQYAVDLNPLVREAVRQQGGSLGPLEDDAPVLSVAPPAGATVSDLSIQATVVGGIGLSVPLERLDARASVALSRTSLTVEENRTATVAVRNTGEVPLSLSSITLAGGDDAFSVTDRTGVIPAGDALTLAVERRTDDAANATLRVHTNATDRPTTTVSLTAPPVGPTVEVQRGERRENATVTVTDQPAGEPVSAAVNVTAGNATIENMSVTLAESRDFSMTVRSVPMMDEEMPAMDTSNKTVVNTFVVEHTFDNDEVTRATMTVTVPRGAVAASDTTDPDEVALFRHAGGGWTEANTTLLGSTDAGYRYRVVADGYSEWATAGKQAEFRIVASGVNVSSVRVGETVTVSVRIENTGGADGRYHAELLLNDEVVDDRRITIAAKGTGEVNFERALSSAGTYEVQVNDVLVDEVRVEPTDADEDQGATGEDDGDRTDGDTADSDRTGADASGGDGADQQADATPADGNDNDGSGAEGGDAGTDGSDGGLPVVPVAGAVALLVVVGLGIYAVRS